jgi:glycosyltransferase involved in cell wall biosynthesis
LADKFIYLAVLILHSAQLNPNIKYPKISIVTVNLNCATYLEEAILSVLSQNYPNLEYIIIDGGSTDGSLEIIKKYEDRLTYWVSEKDEGQYEAIQKGFEKSTGDIMAWINADDKYVPGSFVAVARIMDTFPDVNWLMGIAREYTEHGTLIGRIQLPWSRWSKQRYYTNDFQFIQQESSFWTRSLWLEAGGNLDFEYKYAGDMELWSRFFRYEKLHTTIAVLSGFRHHSEGQRSKSFKGEYLAECKQVIKREKRRMNVFKRIHYFCMKMPRFFLGPFFFFDVPGLKWFYKALFSIPKVIHYDFEANKYTRKDRLVKYPPVLIGKKQVHSSSLKKTK